MRETVRLQPAVQTKMTNVNITKTLRNSFSLSGEDQVIFLNSPVPISLCKANIKKSLSRVTENHKDKGNEKPLRKLQNLATTIQALSLPWLVLHGWCRLPYGKDRTVHTSAHRYYSGFNNPLFEHFVIVLSRENERERGWTNIQFIIYKYCFSLCQLPASILIPGAERLAAPQYRWRFSEGIEEETDWTRWKEKGEEKENNWICFAYS